ncbi:MAG: heme-binding protein [Mesorhizobium sp.]|nr:MAG: heme-binding protein [Mesorhizobium sp.]
MTAFKLVEANRIIEGVFLEASRVGLKPLSVAVLDTGGHVVAFQKQDGSSMLRFEIAVGKAYGALAVGFGSRWLEKAAVERPHFVAGLNAVSGGKIVPVPGGVLVRNNAGDLLGAVGVTGDTSDNDETVAVFGIAAADLQAQTE